MSLFELTDRGSPWLNGTGPHSDVVISSRVRLARNIAGFPFLARASSSQRRDILSTCARRIVEHTPTRRLFWHDLTDASQTMRQLLVERHLISNQLAVASHPRGVAISEDEAVSIMVNEEDHLRMQVMRSGMQLDDAYAHADQVDDALEAVTDYAFSPQLGYLTACPTNVGTGIRVSVMMHLPALVLTGEIEKVKNAAKDMHLAVRGFYGEGTEALGDFYQLSNQTTLGRSERDLLNDFQKTIVPRIIQYEQQARQTLLKRRPTVLDDRVFRAWGVLQHARLLGSEEVFALLSYVRLGLSMGRIAGIELKTLNELMVLTQPAHLQRLADQRLDNEQQREFRASFVRVKLGV